MDERSMDIKKGTILKGKNNRLFEVVAIHNYVPTLQDIYSGDIGIQMRRLHGSKRTWISFNSHVKKTCKLATEHEIAVEKVLYG